MKEVKEEIYEMDYTYKEDFEPDIDAQQIYDLATKGGLLTAVDERMRALPHIINPKSKQAYEDCLNKLEEWTKERHGKIKGVISYYNFESFVKVELPFIEFLGKEEVAILNYVSQRADAICFYTTENNTMLLSARFNYFEDIGDLDAILGEEIKKRPELSTLLVEKHIKDVNGKIDEMLNDEVIFSKIKIAADSVGVTPKEWLERFVEVFEENPQEILNLLNNQDNI